MDMAQSKLPGVIQVLRVIERTAMDASGSDLESLGFRYDNVARVWRRTVSGFIITLDKSVAGYRIKQITYTSNDFDRYASAEDAVAGVVEDFKAAARYLSMRTK